MKKKLLCVTIAAIISVMTACGSGSDNPAPTEPVVQADSSKEPTQIQEPTEAPEPTEVVEPTLEPEPVEEDLIIDGLNISEFNRSDENFPEFYKKFEFDTYKLLAITSFKHVETILSDGDTYQVREGDGVQFNYLILYSPIEIGQLTHDAPAGMINYFGLELPEDAHFEVYEILDVPDEGGDLKLEIWDTGDAFETMTIHITK